MHSTYGHSPDTFQKNIIWMNLISHPKVKHQGKVEAIIYVDVSIYADQ